MGFGRGGGGVDTFCKTKWIFSHSFVFFGFIMSRDFARGEGNKKRKKGSPIQVLLSRKLPKYPPPFVPNSRTLPQLPDPKPVVRKTNPPLPACAIFTKSHPLPHTFPSQPPNLIPQNLRQYPNCSVDPLVPFPYP